MKNEVFSYDGNPVTFQVGEVTMVNATEMAKPFRKTPKDWLRNNNAKDFIASLSAVRQICLTKLVMVVQGGNYADQGTWMHEDVALEFARWLDPRFAIWCNDRIKELFRHGITATPQAIESILSNPDNAIRMLQALKDERKKVDSLKEMNKAYQAENRRLQKIQNKDRSIISELLAYTKDVFERHYTFTTTQIAKDFGMSARQLNKFLHDSGIIFKQGGQWFLYNRYADKGYMESREYTYTKKDGTNGIILTSVWTEAGRMFVKKLVKSELVARKINLL